MFNIYNGMFKYDKTPINATIIEDRIDINDAWYKQVVEIDAAYNEEKIFLKYFHP